MKKIISIILSLAITVSLAACAKTPEGNEETTGKTNTGEQKYKLADDFDYSPFALCLAIPPVLPKFPTEEDYANDPDAASAMADEWSASFTERRNASEVKTPGYESFVPRCAEEFLTSPDGENTVCSPINIYFALAMLSEITDGESRRQLNALLGEENEEQLEKTVSALWNKSYLDDGTITCRPANSLWLRNDTEYNKTTLEKLGDIFYAQSFSGDMSAPEYSEALRGWLNDSTNGLLKDSAEKISFDPLTVIALASSVYFSGKWADEFAQSANTVMTFRGSKNDTETEFMHCEDMMTCKFGDNYTAVTKPLMNGAVMNFILPDEGTDVNSLLETKGGSIFTSETHGTEIREENVRLSVPKFDVTCDTDLITGLKNLGVKDVFDDKISDFSPLADGAKNLYVSRADHSARVKIDEKGCEAAAFTVITVDECAAIEITKTIEITLDRPFIFSVTLTDGTVLFAGVINQL